MRLVTAFLLTLVFPALPNATAINGRIVDASSGEVIPFATVRVLGTGQSTSANETGQYQLKLQPGHYEIKFSHIAHYSEIDTLDIGDTTITLDIRLQPALVDVGQIKVYDRNYDEAQRIIADAIAHKEAILAKIKRYSFDAYTKLVVRDTAKPDSTDIILITETQLTGYWQYPDKYKEIITARKQSANLEAENNLVAVGDILNFNKNRIDMGRYAVVSPTATDALDYYNYYIHDTTYIDGSRVFVLEIEPKNDWTPLFEGTISIVDSTYDVVGVDVGFNKGFESSILKQPRYRQAYAEFEQEYWMPTLIQFNGIVDLPVPGIPTFKFDYSASMHEFVLNTKFPDDTFDEYALEVDEDADKTDTAAWNANQLVPLTLDELRGYTRIDSVEHAPKPVYKQALGLTLKATLAAAFYKDFFHFNRVEGPYLGLSYTFDTPVDRLEARLKSGYAFDAELWQNRIGLNYLLSTKRRTSIDVNYHDEINTRPTMISETNGNATARALLFKSDPYDYFRERGFEAAFNTKLLNFTTLRLSYGHFDQLSEINHSDYSMFGDNDTNRTNPSIIDGQMRRVGASLSYDSRKLYLNKGRTDKAGEVVFTTIEAGLDHSAPGFLDSDYDFTRYHVQLFRRQRTLGWGLTSLYAYGGTSKGTLPPQELYTVDFGSQLVNGLTAMHTLGDSNYVGDRALLLYGVHDFGTLLFRASRLPLIKKLPFSLNVHGGVFWSEFRNRDVARTQRNFNVSPNAYSELGFGLGHLLPLGIVLDMTWQLSDHQTTKFMLDFSGSFF